MAATQQHPIDILQVLETRSRECASPLPQQGEPKSVWRGIGFRLGKHLLVTPITQVQEIRRYPRLTAVPKSHPWVKGLTNLRGRLLSVIDLGQYLGEERPASPLRARLFIVHQQGAMLGLLVNEILGLKHFDPEERLSGEHEQDSLPGKEYIRGAFEQAEQTWHLFDMKALQADTQIRQLAS